MTGRRILSVAAFVLMVVGSAAAEPPADLTTGSIPAQQLVAGSQDASERHEGHMIVLGFAGDVGFSGNGDVPSTEGAVKHGTVIPWQRLTGGVSRLLTADANFANLETVISASGSLTPIEKSYTFLGNPAGLRAAIDMGFNVFTVANNHAQDFGPDGIVETLSYLAESRNHGLKAFAGLGIGAARYEAARFDLGAASIGVAAIGLAINHAGPEGPGQPLYASAQDFARVVSGLAATEADVRVLSVHYGRELVSLPAQRDKDRFRRTIDSNAASVVFGHHAHVPSGIEYRDGGLIFYGLGNFMHSGTQDMSRYGACRDFGLYAQVYFWSEGDRPPVVRAVELFPVRGMHAIAEPVPAAEATQRIAIVNALNRAVTEHDRAPLWLESSNRASGLACFGDQTAYGDELAARCRAAAGPRAQSRLVDDSTLASCGREPPPPAPSPVVAQQPPIPVAKPVLRKPVKALAAREKSKERSSLLQKLLD